MGAIEGVYNMDLYSYKIYTRIAINLGIMVIVSCMMFSVNPLDAQAAVLTPTISCIPHAPIQINSSLDFTPANGVFNGNGSSDNPWIIENLSVNGTGGKYCIYIRNTTDHFIIRNCYLYNNFTGTEYVDHYLVGYDSDGIVIDYAPNGLIENNIVEKNYDDGIDCLSSCFIKNNTIRNNRRVGISMIYASDIIASDNILISNYYADIQLGSSKNITLIRNSFTIGISIEESGNDKYNSFNIDTSNKINGRPIYYLKNQIGGVVPYDAGQVIVANCSEIIIENLNINFTGARGIIIGFSNNNTIRNNVLSSNYIALEIINSASNFIYNNTIKNSNFGLFMFGSNNTIYHNSFINNTFHTSGLNANIKDDGYPFGGNYWDNYNGTDVKSGPSQDSPGSDGIGDTPYTISSGNIDRYPLMKPYSEASNPQPPNYPPYIMFGTIIIIIIIVVLLIYYNQRRKAKSKPPKPEV